MVDTAQKDMRLIMEAAEEMNVALPDYGGCDPDIPVGSGDGLR